MGFSAKSLTLHPISIYSREYALQKVFIKIEQKFIYTPKSVYQIEYEQKFEYTNPDDSRL